MIAARDADVYFGVMIEPFVDKAGHIPSSRSLPTPWIWNPDRTYKDAEILSAMASGVVDKHKAEIVVLLRCGRVCKLLVVCTDTGAGIWQCKDS